MRIFDAYRYAVNSLENAEIPDAAYEAKFIFESVFSLKYSEIIMNPDTVFNEESKNRLDEILNFRKNGEPLQYILGKWSFMGFDFEVGDGVLIPRSETELLVENAVERLKNIKNPVVYDLCSGSGCIGLSIKKLVPQARVFMVEISDKALYYLNLSRENLGLMKDTCVIKGDILKGYEAFSSLPSPDVIVSNPPYVKSDEIPLLQKEVQFEPSLALDGGDDGYVFYRSISEKWLPFINKNGYIAVECGENQAEYISSLFGEKCKEVEIINDYSGIQRIVTGKI